MQIYKTRIRELREIRGKNQTEIATILDTTQTIYSRYERQERELPIQHLVKLSEYYEVSTDFILGKTDNPKPYPPAKED